jgi:uncharacterized protein YlxW (UPF0749 family)
MWDSETLKALATGIAAGIVTILMAGAWLWKFTKALDLIPKIQEQISLQAAETAEATRKADAAHRRLDDLRDKHEALKNTVTTLDERTRNQGQKIEDIADQIMGRLDKLDEKLDQAIRDGVIAGRK